MSKKLLAIDLDGTLFYPKERFRLIHPKNIQFIRDFVAQGNEVVLVTSRSRNFTEKTIKKIGLPLNFVSRNGAVVVYQGEVIADRVWPKELAYDLYQKLIKLYPDQAWSVDSRQFQNVVHIGRKHLLAKLLYHLYYFFQGVYRESYISDEKKFLDVLHHDDIHRVLVFFGLGKKGTNKAKNARDVFKDQFPHLEFSWIEGLIEIAPLHSNKLTGLQMILDRENIAHNQVYVVGDSGNDTVLFKHFYDHSFVMNNAHPEIKKQAKTIIRRVFDLRRLIP